MGLLLELLAVLVCDSIFGSACALFLADPAAHHTTTHNMVFITSTVLIIGLLTYTSAAATVSTAVVVSEYRERNRYRTNNSVTRTSKSDIKNFIGWFQENIYAADHIVYGIDGILSRPCIIPHLGIPFKYKGLVFTLTHNGSSYAIKIGGPNMHEINRFWDIYIDQ